MQSIRCIGYFLKIELNFSYSWKNWKIVFGARTIRYDPDEFNESIQRTTLAVWKIELERGNIVSQNLNQLREPGFSLLLPIDVFQGNILSSVKPKQQTQKRIKMQKKISSFLKIYKRVSDVGGVMYSGIFFSAICLQ